MTDSLSFGTRTMASKKKTDQSLPIKRKLEIINRVEHLPLDKKKKHIAAEFGIPSSNLSTTLKNKDTSLRNAEDEDSDDNDADDELSMVMYNHACSAFETLRSFFLRSSQVKAMVFHL